MIPIVGGQNWVLCAGAITNPCHRKLAISIRIRTLLVFLEKADINISIFHMNDDIDQDMRAIQKGKAVVPHISDRAPGSREAAGKQFIYWIIPCKNIGEEKMCIRDRPKTMSS